MVRKMRMQFSIQNNVNKLPNFYQAPSTSIDILGKKIELNEKEKEVAMQASKKNTI